MANELEGIARSKQLTGNYQDYTQQDNRRRRSARAIRETAAPEEAWDFPASEEAVDSFSHTEAVFTEYSNYNEHGEYQDLALRILPRRYYNGTIRGNIYYKGGTIARIALLEEAVSSGAIELNEDVSIQENLFRAEKVLIEDKAKPMYPWSTSLYSEDEQYRIYSEAEGGVRAEPAFYVAADGSKTSAEELAEQLADGVLPEDMSDDTYRFLWDLDRELCTKARMIGQAVRSFREKDEQLREGKIDEARFLRDVHVYVVYFLGRDEGPSSAEELRNALMDPDFPGKALRGMIAGSEPTSIYRRPVILRNAFDPPPPHRAGYEDNGRGKPMSFRPFPGMM